MLNRLNTLTLVLWISTTWGCSNLSPGPLPQGPDAGNSPDVESVRCDQATDNTCVFEALKPHCLACHGEGTEDAYFESLENFEAFLVADRRLIEPGFPNESALLDLLRGEARLSYAQMPPEGDSFAELAAAGKTEITMDELSEWIEAMEPGQVLDCDQVHPGPAPVRRLTVFEYNRVVRDLLGISSDAAVGFPTEEETYGFDNDAMSLGVTMLLAEKYFEAAENAASLALSDPLALAIHLELSCREVTDSCLRQFIEVLAYRAYRRPLETEELIRIFELYQAGRAQFENPLDAVGLVIAGILQSPHFLYRIEFGTESSGVETPVTLTDFEMASRLSFFLWGTMPDSELFAAAEAGMLRTPEQIESQARRMLSDERSRPVVEHFFEQWLRLDELSSTEKDPAIFPEWTPGIASMMHLETSTFIDDVVFGQGTLRDLYTAEHTFINENLAAFYGHDVTLERAFERVDFSDGRHAGILTQGGLMAVLAKYDQTSPVVRGVFVREQLLCQPLPSPPDNVDNNPPEIDPSATTRERFAAHREEESCAACHKLIDPVGLGFEHFDGIGRWRDREADLAIDSSGELIGAGEVSGPFTGASELAQKLADDTGAQSCFVKQWFRFAHGRAETEDDHCTMNDLAARFEGKNGRIDELLIAITQTEAFRFRMRQGGAD